jgi:hypothetical protein
MRGAEDKSTPREETELCLAAFAGPSLGLALGWNCEHTSTERPITIASRLAKDTIVWLA